MNPNPTTTQTMQRDALVAMILAGVTGLLVGGLDGAGQALACAGLAALNLQAYRWLVERTTADVAAGGDGGLSGMLLAGKLMATLAVLLFVLQFVQPVALVIGLATVLAVTAVTGTLNSLREEATA